MKIVKRRTLFLLISAAFVLQLTSFALAGELVIIVNKKSGLQNITQKELQNLFLGKYKALPSGQIAVLFEQKSSAESRQIFLDKIVQRTEAEYRANWSRMIFTGIARPPTQVNSEEEVIKAIAETEAAISYVSASAISSVLSTEQVKIIMRVSR